MMAAGPSSSSSGASPSPAEEDREKPRLSQTQKRANHIASEQKRRQAIRQGFDRLSEIVPGLEGQARSEGLVIHTTVEYIRNLMLERRTIIQALEARGIPVEAQLKSSLETFPAGWLDSGTIYGPAHSDESGDQHPAEGNGSSVGGSPRSEAEEG